MTHRMTHARTQITNHESKCRKHTAHIHVPDTHVAQEGSSLIFRAPLTNRWLPSKTLDETAARDSEAVEHHADVGKDEKPHRGV